MKTTIIQTAGNQLLKVDRYGVTILDENRTPVRSEPWEWIAILIQEHAQHEVFE